MFKWILIAALSLSIGFCAFMDFASLRKIDDRKREIAEKQTELKPLQPIVAMVEDYQRKKDDLQRHIDAINQLKQNQVGPARQLARLTTIDPSSVVSVAVVQDGLVVNRK